MNIELDSNYIEALEVIKKYHKESIGFTNYEGTAIGDKIYPKQNNLEIVLLVKICQKLDYINIRIDNLEQKINKLSFEKEIDKLAEQFSKIPVEKKPAKIFYCSPNIPLITLTDLVNNIEIGIQSKGYEDFTGDNLIINIRACLIVLSGEPGKGNSK